VSVVERQDEDGQKPRPQQGGGAVRRLARYFRRAAVTTGEHLGMSGEDGRVFLAAFFTIAVLVGALNTVNVITLMHDMPDQGIAPIVWEGSSWLTILAFLWIPWIAYRFYPPGRMALSALVVVHMLAVVLFSAAHVAGFVLIRMAVYAAAGQHYGYGPFGSEFFYELRKDAFGYSLIIAIFWVSERLLRAPPVAPGATCYDIRDGARIVRVRFDEILAIASAGNYVEFVLRDGRRPLMRKPLSAIEEDLKPLGFLRTHRSWVVNAARVTGLKPEGSGDYAVELGSVIVPLSRRYPQALAMLRANPTSSPHA